MTIPSTDLQNHLPPPPLPDAVDESRFCIYCYRSIASADRYCRHCGRLQARYESIVYHPLVILLLALVIMGPFALVLVWQTTRASRPVKIALATVIVLYSALTFYALYRVSAWMYKDLQELNTVLQHR